jgi:hypothetical protein
MRPEPGEARRDVGTDRFAKAESPFNGVPQATRPRFPLGSEHIPQLVKMKVRETRQKESGQASDSQCERPRIPGGRVPPEHDRGDCEGEKEKRDGE